MDKFGRNKSVHIIIILCIDCFFVIYNAEITSKCQNFVYNFIYFYTLSLGILLIELKSALYTLKE